MKMWLGTGKDWPSSTSSDVEFTGKGRRLSQARALEGALSEVRQATRETDTMDTFGLFVVLSQIY